MKLTQTSPIQVIVSNESGMQSCSGESGCEKPTGSPGVARLPVNRYTLAVVDTSRVTFSKSAEITRSSPVSVNVRGFLPAF